MITDSAEMETWLRENAVAMVNAIAADAAPKWGIMTGRHLVEHLTGSMRMSNGRFDLKLRTPEDKVAKYKAWLLQADTTLTPNVKIDAQATDAEPLRDASVEASREKHAKAVEGFFEHFKSQPSSTPTHPIFGALTYTEWLVFHYKHYIHHLAQFGQVPIPEHKSYDSVR